MRRITNSLRVSRTKSHLKWRHRVTQSLPISRGLKTFLEDGIHLITSHRSQTLLTVDALRLNRFVVSGQCNRDSEPWSNGCHATRLLLCSFAVIEVCGGWPNFSRFEITGQTTAGRGRGEICEVRFPFSQERRWIATPDGAQQTSPGQGTASSASDSAALGHFEDRYRRCHRG